MSKNKNARWAILLVVAMLLGILPLSVYATEVQPDALETGELVGESISMEEAGKSEEPGAEAAPVEVLSAIIPLAAVDASTLDDVRTAIGNGATEIQLTGEISVSNGDNGDLSAPNGTAVTIYAATGARHFATSGEVTMNLTNVVLDGNGTAGGMDAADNLTIVGGTIQNCAAVEYGGGIYTQGSVTLSGTKIQSCTAKFGGGIYFLVADKSLTGGVISDCTASTSGGGVYANGTTITDTQISNCHSNHSGGGIHALANLTITNVTIQACTTGNFGGGIDAANGNLYIIDSEILSCKTTNDMGSGGGVLANVDVNLTNSTIDDCDSASGGGIYSYTGENVVLTGSSISNCSATENGGGVYAYYARNMSLTDSTISQCTATENGGGIYLYLSLFIPAYKDALSNLTLSNVIMSENQASRFYIPSNADLITLHGEKVTNTTTSVSDCAYVYNNYDVGTSHEVFRIHFMVVDGLYKTAYVMRGEPLSPPTTPTHPTSSSQVFTQWEYGDGTVYDFASPVTADLTLCAAWRTYDPGPGTNPKPKPVISLELGANALTSEVKDHRDTGSFDYPANAAKPMTEAEFDAAIAPVSLKVDGVTTTAGDVKHNFATAVDLGTLGSYEVAVSATYKGTSYSETVTVQVVDTTKPVIEVEKERVTFGAAMTQTDVFAAAGIVVTDNYDSDVAYTETLVGSAGQTIDFASIDWNVKSEFAVELRATDMSGNAAVQKMFVLSIHPEDENSGGNRGEDDSVTEKPSIPDQREQWEQTADGEWVFIGDGEAPQGDWTQDSNGTWTFSPDVPAHFDALPQTGNAVTMMALILALVMILGGTMLYKRKEEYEA